MSHATTLNDGFLREHSPVLVVSVLAHLALFVLLALNLSLMPRRQPQPVRLAIQATVVDSRALRPRTAPQPVAQPRPPEPVPAPPEPDRAEEQRREAQERAVEQKRVEKAEALRQEQARKAQDAEKARQAAIEQQRKAAEQKQAAAEAKRKAAEQQKQVAEQQKQAAAESKRKADAERRAAQNKADLARQMAAEEDLNAAEDSGLLDQYGELIKQQVERNWIRPASAKEGISCVVLVKQIPGGDVVDVRVSECNGDAAVVRSIEAAVLRSSPLPPPPDATLFDRNLTFTFRPRD